MSRDGDESVGATAERARRRFVLALGEANLSGLRGRMAKPVARAVSNRTRFTDEQVAAIIGLAFLALSIYGLISTARKALDTRYV